jgi:NTP pyrophosphatase (non-canonical NTP hydrolase)
MKYLLFTLLAFGCTPEAPKTPEARLEAAKEETKEAARALKEYTFAQKDEFVTHMKAELAEMQTVMDTLSTSASAEAKEQLEQLREQWARAKTRLEVAEGATEESWEELKAGFKTANDELNEAFLKTRQWVSDKIEP